MARKALIVGATGLVGSRLLDALLSDPGYDSVRVLTRRPLGLRHSKLDERIVDFDRLAEAEFPQADDVFCCLGTTIMTAGSQAAFYRVDFTCVHDVARLALAKGAQQFLLISAMGASPRSRIFYSRVKGEIEEALRKLAYRSVFVLRPSFLAGDRKENRPGEKLALAVLRPLRFLLPLKYRPVSDIAVARAMLACAKSGATGFQVIESDRLQQYAP